MAKSKYLTTAPAEIVSRPTTLHYHAASVRCRTIETSKYGAMEACFFGPINETSFYHLQRVMLADAPKGRRLVIRMDKALTCFDGVPDIPNVLCPEQFPQMAVIARRDELDFWYAYGRKWAQAGVICITFIESRSDLAYSWAGRPFVCIY